MGNEHPIRINVDVSNPGQFFACCGLLELADRLWPRVGVVGAFTSSQFELWTGSTECSLQRIFEGFVRADVQQLDLHDKAASPLYLSEPFNLRLDWWQKVERANKTRIDLGVGGQLKTWAGKQLGPLIFRVMKNACVGVNLVNPFDHPKAVYETTGGKTKKKTSSPFYFDSRREETSLDVGFSPDEQEMSVVTYPAVESLALVGLQRFRPAVRKNDQRRSFFYTVWTDRLPPLVAMAVVCGMIPTSSGRTFRFNKPSRGGEYLTMFSRSTPERSNYV
jgi:CRISPR-associated protein Csb3